MTRILKRIAAGVVIAGVAALLLAAGGYAAGARVNTTKSIPVGLYWTSSAPVEKGAYVLFCPPQLGVFDDAKEIKADKAGRPLPRYQSNSYTLGNSEVLLMSDVSATSFDGRYFGPINRSQIKTVIRPVITW